jgi:cell division protein FtsB
MRLIKYLLAPWLAVLFYAAVSLFWGNTGFFAYDKFDTERKKQTENIGHLRRINSALLAEKEALSSDPETIALEAMNMGYGKDGETHIRIDGFNGQKRPLLESGKIVRPKEPAGFQNDNIKIYSLYIFFIVFCVVGLTDIIRFVREA